MFARVALRQGRRRLVAASTRSARSSSPTALAERSRRSPRPRPRRRREWTRLTISPPKGRPAVVELLAQVDGLVERLPGRAGDDQERACRSAPSSSSTRSARSRKPPTIPDIAAKNSERSWIRSVPVSRLSTRVDDREAASGDLHPEAGRPDEEADRAALDEMDQPARARRGSRARCGGRRVEDEQVVLAVLAELVELLHRHVLLRARERAGDLLVDAVAEDRARGTPRRARAATTSSNVAFASSIVAQSSPPPGSTPAALEERRVDAELIVAELVQPERVGKPLGGVDRQHGDLAAAGGHAGRDRGRGRRLADPAGADADADRRARRGCPRSWSLIASSRRARRARPARTPASKRKGSSVTGAVASRLEAAELLALRCAAAPPRRAPRERRRDGRRLVGAAAAIASPARRREALRAEPVDEDGGRSRSRPAVASRESTARAAIDSFTAISSAARRSTTPVRS